eukprot:405262-Prymnesium_polylepis.1
MEGVWEAASRAGGAREARGRRAEGKGRRLGGAFARGRRAGGARKARGRQSMCVSRPISPARDSCGRSTHATRARPPPLPARAPNAGLVDSGRLLQIGGPAMRSSNLAEVLVGPPPAVQRDVDRAAGAAAVATADD